VTNTRIDYVYADASNYKVWGREVLEGTLTAEEKAEIIHVCESGEFFIASQVGLPDLQHQMWNEHRMNDDDHVFHRLALGDFTVVDTGPTIDLTAAQLLANFRMVASRQETTGTMTGWDVPGAMRVLGLEQSP
jgi:hypothetical protein